MSRTGGSTARHLVLLVWLTGLWCFLWEDVHPGTVLAGLLVAAAVTALLHFPDEHHRVVVRPLAVVRFGAWFAWALVTSTWNVVRVVVAPRLLREGIVAVPIRGDTDFITTLVANTISLTPGTLTLEARPGEPTVLFVHAMQLDDPDDVRADVARIEALAVRAFGPAAAVTRLGEPPPALPAHLAHGLGDLPVRRPGGDAGPTAPEAAR